MTDARLAETETAEGPARQMTWEEWLAWAPDSRITEWVEGKIIEMSPIGEAHDAISRWLITVLELFLIKNNLGKLRTAPSVLKLSKSQRGREPDLMFISNANLEQAHSTYVEGPVDAVWEIISPESAARDRGEKFVEYEAEGIREYWLIDPERKQIGLYQLGDNKRYQLVPPREGKYESSVLSGFYVRPEWLWETPSRTTMDALRELGVL